MATTTKAPAPTIKLHSFASCAKIILNADAKAASAKAQAINAWLDKYIRASDLPKTSAGAELLRAHVAQCEVIPTEQRNTFRAYASGMVYAWVHGVPWTSTITQQGLGLPWSDKEKKSTAAKTSAAKSAKPRGRAAGKPTGARPKTTKFSRQALDAALRTAIEQARGLGLVNFAADIGDLAREALTGFDENAPL